MPKQSVEGQIQKKKSKKKNYILFFIFVFIFLSFKFILAVLNSAVLNLKQLGGLEVCVRVTLGKKQMVWCK